jgi:predicted NBD/HSP70 family sugar kinase
VRNGRTGGLPIASPGAVAVVTALVTEGPMSRAELSRRTGLTTAAVTKVVTPLADAGYVTEGAPALSGTLGRPATRLEICGDAAFVVGVKVTGSDVLGVLVDLAGHTRATVGRDLGSRDVDAVVEAIAAVTEELTDGPQVRERLRHLGVGISGGVDHSGLVSYSHFLGWHGVRLAPLLHGRLGLPITVENDVRALTAGERWFGAGSGRSSFAVVTIGAGIGCALSVHGQVLAGTHGVSGELGHLPVGGASRPCHCGATGCLDTVASTASILRDVSDALGTRVEDLESAVAWARTEPVAEQVFQRAGHALGVGIASMVNLFGPECVVLTGEGLVALDLVREPIRAGFVEQAYGQAIHSEIIVRPLGFEAWAHGAATVALQAFVRGGAS